MGNARRSPRCVGLAVPSGDETAPQLIDQYVAQVRHARECGNEGFYDQRASEHLDNRIEIGVAVDVADQSRRFKRGLNLVDDRR